MRKSYELYEDAEGVDFTYFFKTVQERHLFKSFKNRLLGKEYKPTRVFERVYKGYLETSNQIPGSDFLNFSPIKEVDESYDQSLYFKKCITLVQKNNIKVLIVHLPIWKHKMEIYRQSELYRLFKERCQAFEQKYALEVFNSDRNQFVEVLEQRDFLNPEHLNGFGANKFSMEFGVWLNHLKN